MALSRIVITDSGLFCLFGPLWIQFPSVAAGSPLVFRIPSVRLPFLLTGTLRGQLPCRPVALCFPVPLHSWRSLAPTWSSVERAQGQVPRKAGCSSQSLECAGPWGLCSLTSSWGAWEPLAFVLSWLAAALHRPCTWLLCSVAHTWARFTPHPNRTVCLSRSPEFSLTASARGPRSMPDLVLSPPLPCDAPARTCKHSCHRIDSVPNIPIKSMTVNEPLTLPIPK